MIDYLYLKIQNPWWDNPESLQNDEKLKEYSQLPCKYIPEEILSITPDPKDIHVISGPRQTGKSTALKLYIQKSLQAGIDPKNILYFNCDALTGEKDVIDLILEFNKTRVNTKTIILLDEISSVEKWPQGIKWLADADQLTKSTLFLTGSSSINLKKSGEMLPGRRGRGKDIDFLPIDFCTFLQLKGVSADKILPDNITDSWELQKLSANIQPYYKEFLLTGGFLRNINYGVTEETGELYLETLKSELFKNGRKEDSLREVLKKLVKALSAQTSYTDIAEEAELGSKNTAVEYLNFLADSYFIKETKFYDINQQKVYLKKNKKFYTTDPYIVWLFQSFITGSLNFSSLRTLVDDARLTENFVATELGKKFKTFYFYQNSHELDFYLPDQNIGIEVKYRNKITASDINFPKGLTKKIMVSQETLETRDDVIIIPAHLFCLLDL